MRKSLYYSDFDHRFVVPYVPMSCGAQKWRPHFRQQSILLKKVATLQQTYFAQLGALL